VSPKSFVRQVRTALARETDAFRPATHAVHPRGFAGQIVAALARAPIVVVPEPASSANDTVVDLSQEGRANSADQARHGGSSAERNVPAQASEQPQIHHAQPRRRQPPVPRQTVRKERAGRQFLTVAEVASRLGVSKMAVYRLIHSGELVAIRVGRSLRVPEHAVEEMAVEMQGQSDTA